MYRLITQGGGGAGSASEALDPARFCAVLQEHRRDLTPPSSRTKWTRRVPHPVLTGHAAKSTGATSPHPSTLLPYFLLAVAVERTRVPPPCRSCSWVRLGTGTRIGSPLEHPL
jgi:hypothetical protein